MPGEFAKRVENGLNFWTCNTCNEDIIVQAKPRGHLCMNNGSGTTSPQRTPSTTARPQGSASASAAPRGPTDHQFHYRHPPPGFSTPVNVHAMPSNGTQP